MKKSHLVAAGAAATAAAAASVLGAAYGIYRLWFYHAAQPEDIKAEELSKTLPYGEQMKKDADALAAASYEAVQITADDGTPFGRAVLPPRRRRTGGHHLPRVQGLCAPGRHGRLHPVQAVGLQRIAA